MPIRYLPDYLFVDHALHAGRALCVDDEGRVVADVPPETPTVRLNGRVLLPGLVNAHSHAFQRAIRAETEYSHNESGQDDFWTWREAMYAVAARLSPETTYAVSLQAFVEMAKAGITAVGEFHYLHHQPDGSPYLNPNELGLQVIRAARDAGLRVVLLDVAYLRGGFQKPLSQRQLRFADTDVEAYLRRVEALKSATQAMPMVSIGYAPHSVRAVERAAIEAIVSSTTGSPLHMHVGEQPAEVAECVGDTGLRPVELLDACGALGRRLTVIHAIHLNDAELSLLSASKTTVCACPSTERNLGDGVIPADQMFIKGIPVAFGTDSQAHIDLLEEARQLEGHLRLARLRRNVLDEAKMGPEFLAQRLLFSATQSGARSLHLDSGVLRIGSPADFFTVNLNHSTLVGCEPRHLLSGVVFASRGDAIVDVFVGGQAIVQDGTHRLEAQAAAGFIAAKRALSI
jgi:formimidoylglutamate deiminase